MKERMSGIVKFLFAAYIVTFLILAILAFLLFKFNVSQGFVNGGVIFAYIFSSFLAGLLFSKRVESRRFIWGALIGFLYFVIILIISMILNRQLFLQIPNLMSVFVLCTLGGMMGGMLRSGKS